MYRMKGGLLPENLTPSKQVVLTFNVDVCLF